MLKKILQEFLCPEARNLSKKISTMGGTVTLKNKSGDLFFLDSEASITGGYIIAKNEKGKDTTLFLCGNDDYLILQGD